MPGLGADVVVVASLREETWWGYDLGFPQGGEWQEAFNSDVYDNWVNPQAAGNGGRVWAGGSPLRGMLTSEQRGHPGGAQHRCVLSTGKPFRLATVASTRAADRESVQSEPTPHDRSRLSLPATVPSTRSWQSSPN